MWEVAVGSVSRLMKVTLDRAQWKPLEENGKESGIFDRVAALVHVQRKRKRKQKGDEQLPHWLWRFALWNRKTRSGREELELFFWGVK